MKVLVRAFTLLSLALLAAGCGRDTGVLTGTITFDGKSVANGMIAVRSKDGGRGATNANIENGVYRIEAAPVGDVEIQVQSIPPSPPVLPPGANVKLPAAAPYVPIPERYNEFATANLFTTINPGENTLNLRLEK